MRFSHRNSNRITTQGRRQSKTLKLSTNIDQKSLETEFLIAVCRPTGDEWQSKTVFLAIFDPRSSIVKSVFDCRFPDADDNNLTYHSPDYDELVSILRTESEISIDWFFFNQMKANPDKFQAVAIVTKNSQKSQVFKVGNVDIITEDVVKLLGVDIDF